MLKKRVGDKRNTRRDATRSQTSDPIHTHTHTHTHPSCPSCLVKAKFFQHVVVQPLEGVAVDLVFRKDTDKLGQSFRFQPGTDLFGTIGIRRGVRRRGGG